MIVEASKYCQKSFVFIYFYFIYFFINKFCILYNTKSERLKNALVHKCHIKLIGMHLMGKKIEEERKEYNNERRFFFFEIILRSHVNFVLIETEERD